MRTMLMGLQALLIVAVIVGIVFVFPIWVVSISTIKAQEEFIPEGTTSVMLEYARERATSLEWEITLRNGETTVGDLGVRGNDFVCLNTRKPDGDLESIVCVLVSEIVAIRFL